MRIKKIIRKIWESREFKSYIIWGVISSVLNVVMFWLLTLTGLEYRISNIITLLAVRVFCYLTNKIFVFKTKTENFTAFIKEVVSFFLARLVTFFMDYFGVILLVEELKIDSLLSKIIMAVFVIICNYVFSKFFVFKNKRETM